MTPLLGFRSRVLGAFVLLLVGSLGAESIAMFSAAKQTSVGLAEQQLRIAYKAIERTLKSRDQELHETTGALAADFGFREAIASKDVPTIVSALTNQSARIHADVAMFLNDSGTVIASTDEALVAATPPGVVQAFKAFRARDSTPAVIRFHGQLLQLIIVPIPGPENLGWIGIGFYLGDALMRDIKDLTDVDVTLLLATDSRSTVVASTLPSKLRLAASRAYDANQTRVSTIRPGTLNDEEFLTLFAQGKNSVDQPFTILLQMPMRRVAAPMLTLRRNIVASGLAILLLCVAAAVVSAGMISKPVRALAEAVRGFNRSGRGALSAGNVSGDEITHVAQAFEALAQRAHHDALTGLPNRALFSDRLDAAIERAKQEGVPCTVAFIDLNGFKQINDSLGHEMGDLVLRKTAERLVRVLGPAHTVARFGGDEFVLLLEDTDQIQGIRLVEKLVTAVAQRISYPGGTLTVGMSAGMSTCPLLTHDRETLLKLADAAMYRSKMRKKGTVSAGFADLGVPTRNPEADRLDRRLLMSAEMQGADSDDWSTKMLATHGPMSVPAIAPRVATMRAAAIPKNEVERLIALYSLGLLDAPGFETLDHVTRMVAKSLDVPFALISLVDDKRQWFLSRQGLDVDETPREIAFCAHVVFEGHPLIVPDATLDERFAGNPLVTGGPHIRAYAGIPISSQSGHVLGTLCAIDVRPRHFSDDAISTLQGFATVVEELIQGRVAKTRTGVVS